MRALRILVVSNLYPPHHIGGYELGCRDVVNALRARGHEVHVLTGDFRVEGASGEEPGVERSLHFVPHGAAAKHRKIRECRLFRDAVQRHRPEIVYFWNQGGLCPWLPLAAQGLGCRVAFFLSDTNFVAWRVGAVLLRWARPGSAGLRARILQFLFGRTFLLTGWPVIQNEPCHFASHFLRSFAERAGIAVAAETSTVVHWGIDGEPFAAARGGNWPVRRLLYVGQLIPQKGIHTALAALGLLAGEPGFEFLTLTIAGGGMDSAYERQLRAMPAQLGIAERVNFLGKVPRSELPAVYAQHDVLIFPSEWDEPFAITPLEAMAAGLVVVGTTTGGSGELFRNRETAMTFPAGKAEDCADAIRALHSDHALWESVRNHGAREVAAHHTLDAMVDSVESDLRRLILQNRSPS